MEEQKVKIRINQGVVDTQVYALNDLKEVCKNLVEPFDNIGLGITTELLRDVCTGGYREIDRLIHEQVENDSKMIKTRSLREGMKDEAEQALSVFKHSCERILAGEGRHLSKYLQVEKGEVKIVPGAIETITEENTYYLTDPKEIELYALHVKAVDSINRFVEALEVTPMHIVNYFKLYPDHAELTDCTYSGFFIPKN